MCPGQLMTSLTCNHSTSQIAQSKYKIKIIQNNYRDREEDRKRGKTKVIQVCLQLPTSANNVTLLAFVVDRQLLMQQLINITCLLVQQSIDGTDSDTDPPTYYASSVNNAIRIFCKPQLDSVQQFSAVASQLCALLPSLRCCCFVVVNDTRCSSSILRCKATHNVITKH